MSSGRKRRINNLGTGNGKFLKIGNLKVPIREAKTPELVPHGFGMFFSFACIYYLNMLSNS